MPFGLVLSFAPSGKRRMRRGEQGRVADPASQAAGRGGSQASVPAAALWAQGSCSQGLASASAPPGSRCNADLGGDSKCGCMHILPPLSLTRQNERHSRYTGHKTAARVVCLILLGVVHERAMSPEISSTSLMIDMWAEVAFQKINERKMNWWCSALNCPSPGRCSAV